MTSPGGTALKDLSQKLIYMRPEALGKQAARNGNLNIKVTVQEEAVAQGSVFVVRLVGGSSLLEATGDADMELDQVNLKLEFVRNL